LRRCGRRGGNRSARHGGLLSSLRLRLRAPLARQRAVWARSGMALSSSPALPPARPPASKLPTPRAKQPEQTPPKDYRAARWSSRETHRSGGGSSSLCRLTAAAAAARHQQQQTTHGHAGARQDQLQRRRGGVSRHFLLARGRRSRHCRRSGLHDLHQHQTGPESGELFATATRATGHVSAAVRERSRVSSVDRRGVGHELFHGARLLLCSLVSEAHVCMSVELPYTLCAPRALSARACAVL
jgi:hypothetical protein